MRVRLPKPLSGVFGGVSLSRFEPGVIYDVDPDIGAQLVSWGAEVIPTSTSAVVVPLRDEAKQTDKKRTGGPTVKQPASKAAERTSRKRRR